MADTNNRTVAVLGGTGFLGRRVVRHLRQRDFSVRVLARHPDRGRRWFGRDDPQIQLMQADIRDERSVATCLAGVYAVVNTVSLYAEHGPETFDAVHVEAAQRVAAQAQRAGVERLVHVSGIGADPISSSLYIRKRGEGELAVRAAFAAATIVRPSVMFGPDDAFLTTILDLIRRLPVYPMFGDGRTRLQPAYVDDVAAAIGETMQRSEARASVFECGGPRVYAYQDLVRTIAREAGLKLTLVPVPFAAWHVLAGVAELLPRSPITRNQVELMEIDNVASPDSPGFGELGISPHSVEEILGQVLQAH
jgi:NADH dehydrogenase